MKLGARSTIITVCVATCLLALVVSFFAGGYKRPFLVPLTVNSPDGTHLVKTFGSTVAGQRLLVLGDVAGIAFAYDTAKGIAPDQELILHVREVGSDSDIRTVASSVHLAREQAPSHVYDPRLLKGLPDHDTLYFEFEVIKKMGKQLDFLLEAPGLSSARALHLSYQIDSTKLEDGSLVINNKERPGDLGVVVYERPTILALVWQWMNHPQHTLVWVGIILAACAALVLGIGWRFSEKLDSERFWKEAWDQFSWKQGALWIVVLLCIVPAFYWSATQLFHWQDDHFKLMRIEALASNPLQLWFTNHAYRDPYNLNVTPIIFYRPISFSMFPWAIWMLFGTQAFWYHFFALLVLAATASLLFLLSWLFLRNYAMSFLAAVLWVAHSSHVSSAFWWSTTEDTIAAFFILATILFYTVYLATAKKTWFWAVGIAYVLALFSKENAVFLLPMIVLLDALFTRKRLFQKKFIMSRIVPFAILTVCVGVYFVIRTVAVYDPTLPHYPIEDSSYSIRVSPDVIARNTIVYSAWSAEKWLWVKNSTLQSIFSGIEGAYASFFAKVDEGPYYPGVICIAIYIGLLVLWRKNVHARTITLFAGSWWVLMLMPVLLIPDVWNLRWLSLSVWGPAMLVGFTSISFVHLVAQSPKARQIFEYTIVAVGLCYALWVTRLPDFSQAYRDVSNVTQTAVIRFQEAAHGKTSVGDVYIVGVPHDIRGTVTTNLFHLFTPVSFQKLYFVEEEPKVSGNDIVVDMRGLPGR